MSTNKANWLIYNVLIVLEQSTLHGCVHVKDGRIAQIIPMESFRETEWTEQADLIDGLSGWLLPGFIDMHVHGGFGGDFMDADRVSYDRITKFHASQGTTGMLATTMTASKEAIDAVLEAVSRYRSNDMPYAALLGVHLEGPFISEKWPGAQNPDHIIEPQLTWVQQWNEAYPDLIRLLTLAPEKNQAAETIEWMAEQGIIVAAGHTDAKYDEILRAADAGLSHAVHTCNAMRGLHHREPGTLGAVLADDRIYAEIIADGEHVHPAVIRLILKAKPADKVIIITDAIAAAGMPDGDYELGGLAVVVRNGTARLREGNALAGSSLSMIRAVRYLIANAGVSIEQASAMASGNPARELGLYEQTGSIAEGKLADLVLLDSSLNVASTWVSGRVVYERSTSGERISS